ncbi:aminoglycoside N(3)-acetyltransferase [Exiguobacterium sp. s161]|uniref:aminoglycoside N(3)-acetyltransferase n=1 Tax=Exiguobacterium sp. s161 TaxID=2751191 RepID=UPI001BEBE6BD|nr:AAC(3) family N-acetyltransferase [Exiguobacterium sp. s161]
METRNMVTKSQIKEALRELGVTPGMKLFVHTSLKQIGWIPGGVQALIEALQEVVTTEGLIMMPAQSTDNSDPKNWSQPAVPEEWWETIRREMPAYDPAKTVTRGIGRVPEVFRTYPGVVRSNHPMWSVTAWGKDATTFVADHTLENGFGPGSPIERFIEADGQILHIGSPWDTTTVWHYAEYGLNRPDVEDGCKVKEGSTERFIHYRHRQIDSDAFGPIGEGLESADFVTSGLIGQAKSYRIDAKASIPVVMLQLKALDQWLF